MMFTHSHTRLLSMAPLLLRSTLSLFAGLAPEDRVMAPVMPEARHGCASSGGGTSSGAEGGGEGEQDRIGLGFG